MRVTYSISILHAQPSDVQAVVDLVESPSISRGDSWTRITWAAEVSFVTLKPETVEWLGQRQAAKMRNALTTVGASSSMITLYTELGELHDFRVIFQ